jgi:biotin operon repressor
MPNSRKLGIERAREAGASDTEIASALKISRQAVAKAVPR